MSSSLSALLVGLLLLLPVTHYSNNSVVHCSPLPFNDVNLSGDFKIVAMYLLSSSQAVTQEAIRGSYWKAFLSSEKGNSWFHSWNPLMQNRIDDLAKIAEAREDTTDYFRVMMVGDSTMEHQYGNICSFFGERKGRRFDPEVSQNGTPGCCIDTAEGGGRGLCFDYTWFRFLDPKTAGSKKVDAYYFGSGMHLFHTVPSMPLEPMRILTWLHYEALLEATVEALRRTNPDVRIAFMTNHVVSDELFTGEFAAVRDAYRVGEGNSTMRAECENQVEAVAASNYVDQKYYDWRGKPDIEEYIQGTPTGDFTVKTYCEEALLDHHSSLRLARRAKLVMARLGVPIVDAASIVDGQTWASRLTDGRHYQRIVPVEVFEMLGALISPPPASLVPATDVTVRQDESDCGLRLAMSGADRGGS